MYPRVYETQEGQERTKNPKHRHELAVQGTRTLCSFVGFGLAVYDWLPGLCVYCLTVCTAFDRDLHTLYTYSYTTPLCTTHTVSTLLFNHAMPNSASTYASARVSRSNRISLVGYCGRSSVREQVCATGSRKLCGSSSSSSAPSPADAMLTAGSSAAKPPCVVRVRSRWSVSGRRVCVQCSGFALIRKKTYRCRQARAARDEAQESDARLERGLRQELPQPLDLSCVVCGRTM